MQPASQATPLDFTVSIVACGPLTGVVREGMVYAIGVVQPVQSWTVLRSHEDFAMLSQSLSDRQAACPTLSHLASGSHITQQDVINIRNSKQEWLTRILLEDPQARSSAAMRDFLTLGANTILPQYEGVVWTQFPNMAPQGASDPSFNNHSNKSSGHVDDMEMDIMFFSNADDDAPRPGDIEEEQQEDIAPASERYKQVNEAVTDQDEFDILHGDVEMIEDIGSLAQSMGASHLGRSLQLQAEMTNRNNLNKPPNRLPNLSQGLNIRGSPTPDAADVVRQSHGIAGGLGGAMAQAASNGAFKRKAMESAARLDSFKMIRVIGKGSFGTLQHSTKRCGLYDCAACSLLSISHHFSR